MRQSRLLPDLFALVMLFVMAFGSLSIVSFQPADPPNPYVYPQNESVQNVCGWLGAMLAFGLLSLFGLAAIVLLAGLATLAVCVLLRWRAVELLRAAVGWCLLVCASSGKAELAISSHLYGLAFGAGGCFGIWITDLLVAYTPLAGTWLLLSALSAAGLLLAFGYGLLRFSALATVMAAWLVLRLAGLVGSLCRLRWLRRQRGAEEQTEAEAVELDGSEFGSKLVWWRETLPLGSSFNGGELPRSKSTADYKLPPLELLEDPEQFHHELHESWVREKAELLEKTLKEFGYNVKVVRADTGPVITQYEISLEAGLRVGKIHGLSEDLAINLRVPAVRIVSPLPGRDTVGVEVPNEKRRFVRLKEVIESAGEQAAKMRVPLFLGKDVKGKPLVLDLAEMPHLLIAGRTGTGKSVCLNAMILSILMTRRPDEVKMLMIDPKMVELVQYRRIPHLMHPVVTDISKAEAILAWAVDKMEERYDLLMRAGVRHVATYNRLGAAEIHARIKPEDEEERARIPDYMPYIVIFADEMADLMMTAPREVEGYIIRLAQKSRAVGVHLVFATQKPTVDVVTGLIKSNLPARISFQVASRSDSRVVLDEVGAEKLLGQGDMLFLLPGTSQLIRAQATYAADTEIEAVVQYLETYEPEYSRELLQVSTGGGDAKKDWRDRLRQRDELYEQAIEIVVREGRGSVSLLQRALGIGYGRAARLIDFMAEDGIVGEYKGSQAREVLFTPQEWDEIKYGKERG